MNLEKICQEILSPEQLREIREYEGIGFRCLLLDRLIDGVYLGAMAFFLAGPLDGVLQSFGGIFLNAYFRAALFLTVVLAGHVCVSFPLSFYSGYVVEKKYGLSPLSVRGWIRRYALRMLLSWGMHLVLFLSLFALIRGCGEMWVPVAAAVFFLFSVVLGILVPVVILPLFYTIEKLDDPTLLERLQKGTEGTTLKLEGVYRMNLSEETSKANAMLAGLGKTRRVLLGDTLLEHFTPEEIEAVFAHEVGHHVHRHMAQLMALMLVVTPILFFVMDVLLKMWVGNGAYASLPVWSLAFLEFAMLGMGWVLEPLQNGISRKFERQSDAYATSHIANGSVLGDAFVKLAIQNKADPNPNRWEVFWLHSHPAIAERIGRARQNATAPGLEV
ncbi:MAG: M48 family metallopeptidase [Planctomycetia bacterium]|nr:M48 family metallopeptidase [Planctomycetia bacterium]